MVSITVVGKLDDGTFQRCRKAAEFLSANVAGFQAEIHSLYPTDYEFFVAAVLPGFDDVREHKGNVLTYENTGSGLEYIGAKDKFLKWCNAQFEYVDSTNKALYDRMAKVHMRSVMVNSGREYCTIDVSIDGRKEGTLKIELFSDKCPKTCANFVALLKGTDAGTYKNCPFHRIVPNGWIQTGDVVDGTGKGGACIYGSSFADETFAMKHDKAGILGMANSGPHTNCSQFYITVAPLEFLDKKNVAFGRVIDGMRTLKVLSKQETVNERPKKLVSIADCQMLSVDSSIEEKAA